MFTAKQFAGTHCGCRYQQDYRPTLGKDGKKESGTLEVIKFYYDGAIRMEQHCYGEAATFVFGVWAEGMDADGTLHWALPDRRKSYYDEDYLPRKLDRVDEAGNLYFDGSPFRGSWPTISTKTSAGATRNGRCCWENSPEKAGNVTESRNSSIPIDILGNDMI